MQDDAPESKTQDLVRAFLNLPSSYGMPESARIEVVETHISCVFLAGDLVYKLKKAVRLPFLDFTAPSSRRQACERELEVNRRGAPGLYLRVATVNLGEGGVLAIDGPGEAVDWLVVMRRFAEADLLSSIAIRGAFDRDLALRLAESVARYHADAEIRFAPDFVDGLQRTIETNRECMRPFLPAFCVAARVDAVAERSIAELRQVATLLEQRRNAGFLRRCHGDLHLNNICLFEGEVCLFDAIEFSDAFAVIDTLYDLAFLLMDLLRYERRDLANLVLNRYLADRGDWGGLAALRLFLSLRAAIRCHVTLTAGGPGDLASRYLALAETCLTRQKPRLIAVGGLSGTGKSRLSARLAPHFPGPLGAVILRSDVLRKQDLGCDWRQKLGPEGYSPGQTERTYRQLCSLAGDLLDAGHCVVADAVFARPEEREAIQAVARSRGVPFDGLWLEAPVGILEARIEGRRGDASDATVAVLRRQMAYALGDINWRKIDTGPEPDRVLGIGLECLGL